MNKYENQEYLKQEIMGQSRHQFIYGYSNDKRKKIFQELVSDFPIRVDSNLPIAIYLNEFGLPKVSDDNSELVFDKTDILSREYLSFSIVHSILLKTKENNDDNLLNSRIGKLLRIINNYYITPGYTQISDLDELINVLEESKEFYREYYDNYVKCGFNNKSIDDIRLPFLQLELFISQYKRALDISSYFGVIVDKCDDIALSSIKAINSLVGSRINKDISMKIAVEPGMWDSYVETNGNFIEAIHDYGIVELDDSAKKYVKKLKGTNI